VDHELSIQEFGEECSNAYITTIRTFVEQHIITPLAIIRKRRGLPDGLDKCVQRSPAEYSQGRLNLWFTIPFGVESTIGIENTAKVTAEQLRTFLAACRTKFVKAKIEPGTFPPLVAALHLYSLRLRVHCGGSWGTVNRRARNSDDLEDVPLRRSCIHERNSGRPPDQGDHKCR